MRRMPPAPLLLALLLLAATLVPAGEVVEQPGLDPLGRSAVLIPARTGAGSWDGTWVYVTRDAHYALWLRTTDGRPEARLRYRSLASPESFETAWGGKATYALAGHPVTFAITFDRADALELEGTWDWNAEFPDSARREVGTFQAFRAGDGRALVFRFKSYERTLRRKSKVQKMEALPVWTFRKVSKRHALWDELPF